MAMRQSARYSRRQFGKLALSTVSAFGVVNRRSAAGTLGLAAIDSRIKGVRLGAITYSFRAITDANAIVKAMAAIGLGEAELMSNHAEALAGAPGGRGATPELDAWRRSTSPETWKRVRGMFEEAGIQVRLLCYNMNVKTTSDEAIEYGFSMAKGLGVECDHDVDASQHGQTCRAVRRQAPHARRLSRPRQRHRSRRSGDAGELRDVPLVLQIPRDQPGHRPLHRRRVRPGGIPPGNHARITNLHLKDRRTLREAARTCHGATATRRSRRCCSC